MTMKTTKYTDGPWHIGINGGIYQSKSGAQICAYDMATNFDDENTANARLISSAPDLLNALELAIASLNRLANTPAREASIQGTLDVAREAIIKAGGQSMKSPKRFTTLPDGYRPMPIDTVIQKGDLLNYYHDKSFYEEAKGIIGKKSNVSAQCFRKESSEA